MFRQIEWSFVRKERNKQSFCVCRSDFHNISKNQHVQPWKAMWKLELEKVTAFVLNCWCPCKHTEHAHRAADLLTCDDNSDARSPLYMQSPVCTHTWSKISKPQLFNRSHMYLLFTCVWSMFGSLHTICRVSKVQGVNASKKVVRLEGKRNIHYFQMDE